MISRIYSNATKADIERIAIIIRKASKAIRIVQPNIDSIDAGLLSIKLNMVWIDNKHHLHVYLHNNIILKSSGRLRLYYLEVNRHGNSFNPHVIELFNDNLCV